MKKLTYSTILLLCVGTAPALFSQTTTSVADGDWRTPATWNNAVPVTGGTAFIRSGVTSSDNEGSLAGLALIPGGGASSLTMNSGSQITSNGIMAVNNGTLTINTGAALSKLGGSNFGYIARDTGNTGEMIINGGTYDTNRVFFMGSGGQPGSTGTLSINSGSFMSSTFLAFAGEANSNMNIFVNGGSLALDFVDFDRDDNNAGAAGVTQAITVAGGNFLLTTSNEAGSLQFTADPSSVLNFNSGTVTWQGVLNTSEFATFQTTFGGWVDNGFIASSVFSGVELKDNLTYVSGTGAVLAIPEPSHAAILAGLTALLALCLRRRR